MMTETKGAEFKRSMSLIVRLCWDAGFTQDQLHSWWLDASSSLRGSRLRGWLTWWKFCSARHLSLDMIRTHPRPVILYADFISWMDVTNVKPHIRKDAFPAAESLFDLMETGDRIKKNDQIPKQIRRNTSSQVKSAPKDKSIWDLRVFLQYVRGIKDPKLLPWTEFRALCAAIFMVFVPARPCALVRMNTSKMRVRSTDGAYIVPARDKTDFGRGISELVFRHAKEERLSAAWYYDIGVARATQLGCHDALFCSDRGIPCSSPDVLAKGMTELLHIMGIIGYTSYSFRHSLIQAPFDAGLTETQVNAYTGHSNKSHTAVTWYYHLDKHWAGDVLRALPTDRIPICEEASKIIAADAPMEGEDL
jgi:hypothetical protein